MSSSVDALIMKDRGAIPDGGLVMTAHSSTYPIPSVVVYIVLSYPTVMPLLLICQIIIVNSYIVISKFHK